MAATVSRHHGTYARPQKTLPINMPAKTSPYSHPVSKVALSPPELSDTSTMYGSRRSGNTFSDISGDSESRSSRHSSRRGVDIDIDDELSYRMKNAFDPITLDRSIAKQAQASGELNAKQRELAEMREMLQRRMKKTKVNFDETVAEVREARRDIEYTKAKIPELQKKAVRIDPEAYEEARRSRHSRR